MIGPRPCAFPCAYVDPVFTCQSYDSISTSTKNELVRFSCAYAYAYVDPVFTCLHMCDYAYVDKFSLAYTYVIMLMLTSFHLLTHAAYTYAYAYALVKTRL